jgi:hypothetical protein
VSIGAAPEATPAAAPVATPASPPARTARGRDQCRKLGANGLDKMQRRWLDTPKDQPFVCLAIDDLKSEAWRGLSINARRALDAVVCHFSHNKRKDNGDLQISYLGFERAGVTPCMIAPALQDSSKPA